MNILSIIFIFVTINIATASLKISKIVTSADDPDPPILTACHVWFPSRMRTQLIAKYIGDRKKHKYRHIVYVTPKWERIKGEGWRCYRARLKIPYLMKPGRFALRVRGVRGKVEFQVTYWKSLDANTKEEANNLAHTLSVNNAKTFVNNEHLLIGREMWEHPMNLIPAFDKSETRRFGNDKSMGAEDKGKMLGHINALEMLFPFQDPR